MNDAHSIPHLLLVLAAVLATAKLLGAVAQRIGQPSVLGELLAGVLLGASVLGLLDPTDPVIHALAELGVMVLLFEIGLHTDLRAMAKVAGTATTVGIVGVVLPFVLGYYAASTVLGFERIPSLVCGAALTATSIGISARVLSDLGQLNTREGQVVLGAAVLDDIIGLIVLSVVTSMVLGGTWSVWGIIVTTALAVGFILAAVVGGKFLARPFFRSLRDIRTSGTLGVVALAFAFLLSSLAASAGSAMILGAFAAGLVLHDTAERVEIERSATTIGHFLVPIFFASVGASVELSTFAEPRTLAAGGLLIAVGVIGKFAAAYAPWTFSGNKALIGVAMVPRGEVGLIFAQMGLATKAITPAIFSALTLMVMVTTFLAPPVLARVGRGSVGEREDFSGEGGIDDLVAGDWGDEPLRTPRTNPTEGGG
ncbi:MAG TPA: cation:proton antiporter [Gemmatimonadaceae bacterium]|nr:cation:proton antiporter [Gemmatimonadaceae bacterium]